MCFGIQCIDTCGSHLLCVSSCDEFGTSIRLLSLLNCCLLTLSAVPDVHTFRTVDPNVQYMK